MIHFATEFQKQLTFSSQQLRWLFSPTTCNVTATDALQVALISCGWPWNLSNTSFTRICSRTNTLPISVICPVFASSESASQSLQCSSKAWKDLWRSYDIGQRRDGSARTIRGYAGRRPNWPWRQQHSAWAAIGPSPARAMTTAHRKAPEGPRLVMAAGVAAAAAAALYAGWRARCEERQRDTRLEEEDKTTRLFDSEDSGRRVEDVYELLEELGSGVHAVVRLGRKRATGERVAVKCVDKANMRRRQLKREIEILTTVCRRPRRPLRRTAVPAVGCGGPLSRGEPWWEGVYLRWGQGEEAGNRRGGTKGRRRVSLPLPPPTHPPSHPNTTPTHPPAYPPISFPNHSLTTSQPPIYPSILLPPHTPPPFLFPCAPSLVSRGWVGVGGRAGEPPQHHLAQGRLRGRHHRLPGLCVCARAPAQGGACALRAQFVCRRRRCPQLPPPPAATADAAASASFRPPPPDATSPSPPPPPSLPPSLLHPSLLPPPASSGAGAGGGGGALRP